LVRYSVFSHYIQDLKDFMKKAGEITYTTVNRSKTGEGLVEFADREGMEYAVKELDDTKLDGRRIRLIEEKRSTSRSRSRSNRRESRKSEGNRSRSQSMARSEEKTRRRQRSDTPEERSRSMSDDRVRSEKKRRSFSKSSRDGDDSERD